MIPGEKKKYGYWRGRARSFRYAWHGIVTLFRNEANAQFHLGAACAVIVAGWLLGLSAGEWVAVSLCIGGMFAAEGFNTAVEAFCDYCCKERNPLIGKVKDVAAGAVLMMAVSAVAVGLIIFLPKFLALFR